MLVFALVAMSARPAAALDYCTDAEEWQVRVIDVYLQDLDYNNYFMSVSLYDAEAALLRAIDAWNRWGHGRVRLEYVGKVYGPISLPSGSILVTEVDGQAGQNCVCGATNPACEDTGLDSTSTWVATSIIKMVWNGCGWNWTVDPHDGSGNVDLQGVMMHELGHSLLLQHPDDMVGGQYICPDTVGHYGIMRRAAEGGPSSKSTDQRYPARADQQALESKWDWLQGTIKYREVTLWHPPDWHAGSPAIASPTVGQISSVSSAPDAADRVWFSYLDPVAGTWESRVRYQYLNNGYVSTAYLLPFAGGDSLSWDPPAIAQGNGKVIIAHTMFEFLEDHAAYIRYCISADNGANWSCNYVRGQTGGYSRTKRNGVTAAYDPRTDRFLIGFLRDNESKIQCLPDTPYSPCDEMMVFSVTLADTSPRVASIGTPVLRGNDAPAIACADDSGSNNCVFAYVQTNGCMAYGHGDVSPTYGWFNVGFTSVWSPCIAIASTPYVAAAADQSYPFVLSYRQADADYFHTMQKGPYPATSWINPRTHYAPDAYGVSVGGFSHYTYGPRWDEANVFYVEPGI